MAEGNDADPKLWIIDSGCSSHFSLNESEFIDYSPFMIPQKIRLGNSQVIPSISEGTISLNCIIDQKPVTHFIHSIQYVPALTYGLLLCRALTHCSLQILFEDEGCTISHRDGMIIAESTGTSDELYFLDIAKRDATTQPNNGTALTAAPSFNLAHK